MSTFSRTVRPENTLVFWKVRTSPRAAMRWGRHPVMGSPSCRTVPCVGRWKPVMTLKAVVFPAPLGPIRLVTVPAATVKLTPASAATPPNRTVRSRASRVTTRGSDDARRARSPPA